MQLFTILLGLAAAVAWGTADFAGGLASRGVSAVRVVLASQFLGTLALLALNLALRQAIPAPHDLLLGMIAGLAGGTGLVLLYLSLARDRMGVAAPLTAVASGGIPLTVGLVTEGLPGGAQLAGFALALAAIWIISRPDDDSPIRPGNIVLPLLAGIGFGVFLTIIGRVGPDAGFVWPVVAARLASMSLMAALVVAGLLRSRGKSPGEGRTSFPWSLAALAALGDTSGNAFFILSSELGRLDVASVLGALYPAATVLLARLVLGERLTSRQSAGVGVALAAVMLIAV